MLSFVVVLVENVTSAIIFMINVVCLYKRFVPLEDKYLSRHNDIAHQKKNGKSKQEENELEVEKQREAAQENRLTTLDIFAGCGGLSEGLHQSGIYLPLCLFHQP